MTHTEGVKKMRREPSVTEVFVKLGIEFKASFDMVTDDDGESWLVLAGEYINGKRDYLPPRVEAKLYEMADQQCEYDWENRPCQ
jgi:hypothetical protein